jgi:[ribosomal protein S5]-alanine N-acetyltransferase
VAALEAPRDTIRAVSRLPERLDGGTTSVRRPVLRDAEELDELRRRNRDFVGPWDPLRPESFFTIDGQRAALSAMNAAWTEDRAYGFVVVDAGDDDRIVGQASLSNIVRGAWQNATLGYWIDEASNGRGHATTAVRLLIDFAFGPLALHRLMPAVIPRNERSARVLRKNGFRLEGRALRYLQINGAWEDHDLYAMTAEEASGLPSAPG